MRKRFVLCLVLLGVLIPVFAVAVPEKLPYDSSLNIRYNLLSATQQAIYDVLYTAAWNGETEVTFPQPVRYEDVDPVMIVLQYDSPELCGLGQEYYITYYQNKPDEAVGVTMTGTMTGDTARQLVAVAAGIVADLPKGTVETEQIIHDWLCTQVTYDPDAENAHSAYGALIDGAAVCEGYTKAMTLLCRMAGIPCSMVNGYGTADESWGSHSWNLLCMDGIYTQADVTWDDQTDIILYDYLNLSDVQISTDHIRADDSLQLPACVDESVNWHALNGSICDTAEEGIEALGRLRSGETVYLRFTDAIAYDTLLDWIAAGNAPTDCLTILSESQLCLTILPD